MIPIQPTAAQFIAQHMAMNRHNQDIIANNMANMSTPGYQADKAIITADKASDSFLESLSFSLSNKNVRDLNPGEFTHSGSSFDIAIATPDVYLSAQNAKGQNLYTRNGRMGMDKDRQLIQMGSQLPITDTNKSPIVIPADASNITIADDGTISANGQMIAKIGVFKFTDSQTLLKEGGTMMKATVEPQVAEKVSIMQGSYESSNVNPVIALAQMIELQKQDSQDAYVISTYKEQSEQQIDDLLKPLIV